MMPINIEEIIERAIESAFSKALDRTIQQRAEGLFTRALQDGSPLSVRLAEKIEHGFQRFIREGIQW